MLREERFEGSKERKEGSRTKGGKDVGWKKGEVGADLVGLRRMSEQE